MNNKINRYLPCNCGFGGGASLCIAETSWSYTDGWVVDGWYLEPGSQAVVTSGLAEVGAGIGIEGWCAEVLGSSEGAVWGGGGEGEWRVQGLGSAKCAGCSAAFVEDQGCSWGSLRCWIKQKSFISVLKSISIKKYF